MSQVKKRCFGTANYSEFDHDVLTVRAAVGSSTRADRHDEDSHNKKGQTSFHDSMMGSFNGAGTRKIERDSWSLNEDAAGRPTSGKVKVYPQEPTTVETVVQNVGIEQDVRSKNTLDERLIAGKIVGEYAHSSGGQDRTS